MKEFAAIVVLGLVFSTANAAGVYILTDLSTYNQFTGFELVPVPIASVPLGGQAVVDEFGNVTITGLQFSGNPNPGTSAEQDWAYINGTWTTTVGGTSITNTGLCVDFVGRACSDVLFGLAPLDGGTRAVFDSIFRNDGAVPSEICPPVGITPPGGGPCDQVSVVETASSLIITEQSEFVPLVAGTPVGYQYTFTLIPVPATAWLFGSALGLLGWLRGRAAKH